MIGFLLRWSINLLALVVAAKFMDGIIIRSIGNGDSGGRHPGRRERVIRPLVMLLTLPITLLTLGLFTLVINALIAPARRLSGARLRHRDLFRGVLGALIISLVSWLLNIFIGGDGRVVFIRTSRKDGDGR